MGKRTSRYQLSFDFEEEAELDRCAEHIRQDLGLDGPIAYHDALRLCEVHGGAPVPSVTSRTGETVGETIYLRPGIEANVILHELLHRLANGPRYEELNPVRTRTCRREWIELLARRVSG